jgi:hypothetical protein
MLFTYFKELGSDKLVEPYEVLLFMLVMMEQETPCYGYGVSVKLETSGAGGERKRERY